MQRRSLLLLATLVAVSCTSTPREPESADEAVWISLFNGENLDGWIPKIAGYALGENYGNTFRVEDGILKVSYDEYGTFGRTFGSLFYDEPFSHYRLQAEYRFVGEQAEGGPEWGFRDSGIQLHSPPPATMTVEQEFPVSVEMNLIGGAGSGDRPTGDVCTPSTHVTIDGNLFTEQCAGTSTVTVHGDEWVTAEIEVHGGDVIRHFINGIQVAEYGAPQLDASAADAQRLLESGHAPMLDGGYISLQSNSHPIEFRRIQLMRLDAPR